jgi:hypothetical protein
MTTVGALTCHSSAEVLRFTVGIWKTSVEIFSIYIPAWHTRTTNSLVPLVNQYSYKLGRLLWSLDDGPRDCYDCLFQSTFTITTIGGLSIQSLYIWYST